MTGWLHNCTLLHSFSLTRACHSCECGFAGRHLRAEDEIAPGWINFFTKEWMKDYRVQTIRTISLWFAKDRPRICKLQNIFFPLNFPLNHCLSLGCRSCLCIEPHPCARWLHFDTLIVWSQSLSFTSFYWQKGKTIRVKLVKHLRLLQNRKLSPWNLRMKLLELNWWVMVPGFQGKCRCCNECAGRDSLFDSWMFQVEPE